MIIQTEIRLSPSQSSKLNKAMNVLLRGLEAWGLIFQNKGVRGTLTSQLDNVSLALERAGQIVTSDCPWVLVFKVSNARLSCIPVQGNTTNAR